MINQSPELALGAQSIRRRTTEFVSAIEEANTEAIAVMSRTSTEPVPFTSPSMESASTATCPPSETIEARVALVKATRNERSLSAVTNCESLRILTGTSSGGTTTTPEVPRFRMMSMAPNVWA